MMAGKPKARTRRAIQLNEVIPNQVFVGLPWSTRGRWDKAVDWLRTRSPLSFIIVGRFDKQDAEDLLAVIKERLSASSYGVFDATGGNPNVSLEYGYAEAIDLPRVLYVSTHKAASKSSKSAPIISDLAGKKRNQYKQEAGLRALLRDFSKSHAYTIRFDRFVVTTFKPASRKRMRALALKVVHKCDGALSVRRADIVQQLQGDASRYTEKEIDGMIKRLHAAKLIKSQQGPHAKVHIA